MFAQLCEDVWRPSRIESECVLGEAMDFLFPDRRCNPFHSRSTGKILRVSVSVGEEGEKPASAFASEFMSVSASVSVCGSGTGSVSVYLCVCVCVFLCLCLYLCLYLRLCLCE